MMRASQVAAFPFTFLYCEAIAINSCVVRGEQKQRRSDIIFPLFRAAPPLTAFLTGGGVGRQRIYCSNCLSSLARGSGRLVGVLLTRRQPGGPGHSLLLARRQTLTRAVSLLGTVLARGARAGGAVQQYFGGPSQNDPEI